MNIYISSIKGNYVMVYKDDSWQIQNKKDQVDDLYNYNEVVLEIGMMNTREIPILFNHSKGI